MSTIKVFNPAGDAAGEMTVADELLVLDKGEQAVKDVVVLSVVALSRHNQRTQVEKVLNKVLVAKAVINRV